MEKDIVIELQNKLKRCNITKIDNLLLKDKIILEKLLTLNDNLLEQGIKIALASYKNINDNLEALNILIA